MIREGLRLPCPSGKIHYESKKVAKRAAKRILGLGHDTRPHSGFAPYRCPECDNGWCLGHPSPHWLATHRESA